MKRRSQSEGVSRIDDGRELIVEDYVNSCSPPGSRCVRASMFDLCTADGEERWAVEGSWLMCLARLDGIQLLSSMSDLLMSMEHGHKELTLVDALTSEERIQRVLDFLRFFAFEILL